MKCKVHIIKWKIMISMLLLTVIVIAGEMLNSPAVIKATSATLTFSAESREVQIGDTFSVVLYVDSNDTIGSFEAYVSYDDELAEFVEGGSYVSGGEGLLKISDSDSDDLSSSKKYSISFKALKQGTCNFGTNGAPEIYNESGDSLSVSSNRLSISISNSTKLSDNCKLSDLKISPGTLSPEYSNDVTEYTTEVPNDSDMLFISAVPADADAVVSVEGNENLSVGTNFIHIIVTAPSGAQKDIQINTVRLETDADTTEEPQVTLETPDSGTTVSKTDDSVTIQSNSSYTVADLTDDSLIPSGYEKSEIEIDTEKITAYISSNHPESEFVLLYLTNEDGESSFYRYDRVEKTIQRYSSSTITGSSESDSGTNENTNANTTELIVIVVLGSAVIVLSVILAAVFIHRKREEEKNTED